MAPKTHVTEPDDTVIAFRVRASEARSLAEEAGDLTMPQLMRRIVRSHLAGKRAEVAALEAIHSGESTRKRRAVTQ